MSSDTTDIFNQVKEFTYATQQGELPPIPQLMSKPQLKFIISNVISEMMELAATVTNNPKTFLQECLDDADVPNPAKTDNILGGTVLHRVAEQSDALVDAIYYICDGAARNGHRLGEVFNAVHQANMQKVGPDGKVTRRKEDGKILKPEGWKEPDIVAIVQKQCYNTTESVTW